ncbi:hypothetical protein L208DRAFT_1411170 [Tricholoma matsutake]|nr:hypothetical protein L208DRAFT_1411170 [Tricholoma matsutake 945]
MLHKDTFFLLQSLNITSTLLFNPRFLYWDPLLLVDQIACPNVVLTWKSGFGYSAHGIDVTTARIRQPHFKHGILGSWHISRNSWRHNSLLFSATTELSQSASLP